jgi:uncharacterized protein
MQLDVSAALHAAGEEFSFVCGEDSPSAEWSGAEARFLSPVEARGIFVAAKDSVWVRGEVRARLCVACANCLCDVPLDVKAALNACFTRDLDPEDPDLFSFSGHTLDLEDAALGALWLEMPMRVLCKPECLGLCPVCGADRNRSKCACQKEFAYKHPFSALASLLNEDEEV